MVIGLIMFLLPPVPGLPVYFAFGIVLSAQGNESLGEKNDKNVFVFDGGLLS